MPNDFQRTTFETSRLLDFFSEKELTLQIGHPRERWPVAVVKELIDNSLDACESAGVAPEVELCLEPGAFSVRDNGPGLPVETLQKSLDYARRVSDKSRYVAPTRGQLGNALKTVWAAPFVADGEHGRVDVTARGQTHTLDITLDRIAQQPRLVCTPQPDGLVKTGTLIKVYWPESAGSEESGLALDSYTALELLRNYITFNPHARFALREADTQLSNEPVNPAWQKWRPSDPTSPHWYTPERFGDLIAAYLAAEQRGGETLTVRAFAAQFAGLTGTAKQKAVVAEAGLSGAYLHDLIAGAEVDRARIAELLGAMQAATRVIAPARLGIIGETHCRDTLCAFGECEPETIRYARRSGLLDGLPYVVEAAFGVKDSDDELGTQLYGLNWTPSLRPPLHRLLYHLGTARVDETDPVALMLHLACPRLEFADQGKTHVVLDEGLLAPVLDALKSVTKAWTARKRAEDRRVRRAVALGDTFDQPGPGLSVKAAAERALPAAYLKASANNTLPANARQIMYAARPEVMALTGGKIWKESAYFTQHLLPDFMDAHPELTADWDVAYDDRGHFVEPHTGGRIGLGTLAVRDYLQQWDAAPGAEGEAIQLEWAMPTIGPANRYRFALFVEKEGFNPLLEHAQLAERFDLAIMSTKGMSVTAARQLVERLSLAGVTILTLHDFDKSGLSILHTLQSNTRRHTFAHPPRVIDLGLRLADVRVLGLQSEAVTYPGKVDPRVNLQASGATAEECDYLVRDQGHGVWQGERVELNAMASDVFIAWLERKLAGVHADRKVIPDKTVLDQAFRQARRRALAQAELDQALAELDDADLKPPAGLARQVKQRLAADPTLSWDAAVWQAAQETRPKAR